MPAYFEQSDPILNRQFSRFQLPEPRCGAEARAVACALLAEAGEARREGDTGAAVSLECDALRAMRASLTTVRQEVRQ